MIEIDDNELDQLIGETLSELFDATVESAPEKSMEDFTSLVHSAELLAKQRRWMKLLSVKTVVPLVAVIVVAVLLIAYLVMRHDPQGEGTNKTSTQQLSSTTVTIPETTVQTQQTTVPETQPAKTASTSTTVPAVAQPQSEFYVTGFDKTSLQSYWTVSFQWMPSSTPNVSYCLAITESASHNCAFNASKVGTSGSVDINAGDTSEKTYYLFSVTSDDVVTQQATVTYSVPD